MVFRQILIRNNEENILNYKYQNKLFFLLLDNIVAILGKLNFATAKVILYVVGAATVQLEMFTNIIITVCD